MVHRWARATLLGEDNHPPTWNAQGQEVADPVGWLVEGAEALVSTLQVLPDDTRAMVFLKDAPAPRLFWARRQCHETTIHAVDALAARLGRFPVPDEARVSEATALDGIDEILTGFITRGAARFAGVGPVLLEVCPTGAARQWSVLIRDGGASTTRVTPQSPAPQSPAPQSPAPGSPAADIETIRLTGSPVGLYLALWNRTTGEEAEQPTFWRMWRDRARVRWR